MYNDKRTRTPGLSGGEAQHSRLCVSPVRRGSQTRRQSAPLIILSVKLKVGKLQCGCTAGSLRRVMGRSPRARDLLRPAYLCSVDELGCQVLAEELKIRLTKNY